MDNQPNITNKHIRSLAAVMLFAPFLPFILKSWNYELSDEDKIFIWWYIKYWIIIDLLILASIVLSIINFFNRNIIVYYIKNIMLILWIIMIIIGIFMIFWDKDIFQEKEKINLWYKKIQSWNMDIIFYYLPVYNFYLWYLDDKDLKSYRWIKESIILLTLWLIIIAISWNIFLNIIVFLLYILRVVSLIWWIDLINDDIKEKLDKLFERNPEEIFGYIKWVVLYVYDKITSKTKSNFMLSTYINDAKRQYCVNIDYTNKLLIIEYVLLLAWIIYLSRNINIALQFQISWLFYLIPLIIIVWRYLVMLPSKRLPHIPIAYEIVKIWKKIVNLIK